MCEKIKKSNEIKWELRRIPVVRGIPGVTKQWRCVPGFVCTPSLHLDSSPNWDFQTHCARKHRSSGQYFGSVQKVGDGRGVTGLRCHVTSWHFLTKPPDFELLSSVASRIQIGQRYNRSHRCANLSEAEGLSWDVTQNISAARGHAFNLYNLYSLYSVPTCMCTHFNLCICQHNLNVVSISICPFQTIFYIQLYEILTTPNLFVYINSRLLCCTWSWMLK